MNSFGFALSPSAWVIGAVVLITFFAAWFEFRKKTKFRTSRIFAVVVLALSLLGLLLRPFYSTTSSSGIILLTPGYNQSLLDSVMKQNSHLVLMRTPDCIEVRKAAVADDDFIEEHSAQIKFILGEGLSAATLETMTKKNFHLLGSLPPGIVFLSIPLEVVENHAATVTGILNADSAGQLRLAGPAGTEDSVALVKGNQNFSLSFTPRQNGRFVYYLEIQHGNSASREPLPVVVHEEQPLKILFLQKFPTAEIKNLKDFLGQRHHALTLRYQLSKSIYRHEFVNSAEKQITKISQSMLSSFDLIFIDLATLQSLSTPERDDLKKAISTGLGAVVLPSDEPKNLPWFWDVKFKPGAKDTAHVQLVTNRNQVMPVLPFDITSDREIYPEIKAGSRIVSGYVLLGLGKVAIVLLQETYRIKVEGNEQDYARIWTDLITKVSRKKATDRLSITTPFPVYQHEPLEVTLISDDALLLADSISLPLIEDISIDDIWYGRTWAGQPGWHKLETKNSTLHYSIPENSAWKSLRAANRIQATRNAASAPNPSNTTLTEKKEVPLLLFFFLFMVSAGFLWLAPKIG